MDGHIMRCGTIGSCQSAATSEIVKVLLVKSLTHVSGAITSVLTFTFTHWFCPYVRLFVCLSPTKKTQPRTPYFLVFMSFLPKQVLKISIHHTMVAM